ncbi:MAG: VaFE repeat-containing surface-anchored protein [Lachnospiraceae bacterium]|nr:VaFE repeat-containing surface-anchored protein [Lachnospiraceae bacterium]
MMRKHKFRKSIAFLTAMLLSLSAILFSLPAYGEEAENQAGMEEQEEVLPEDASEEPTTPMTSTVASGAPAPGLVESYAAESSRAARLTFSDTFGFTREALVNYLNANKTLFLNTPYQVMDPVPGTGMQCTGFVWYVLNAVATQNKEWIPCSEVLRSQPTWTKALNHFGGEGNFEVREFGSKEEMLSSGYLEKGDILWIYCDPAKIGTSDYYDFHCGIFWGDSSSDDKFWHSSNSSHTNTIEGTPIHNRISGVEGKVEFKDVVSYKVYKLANKSYGNIQLTKVSANPSITEGNSCYSLEGAQYGVYSDAGCTSQIGTLTTDATGTANLVNVEIGTYYVKEIQMPMGYLRDEQVYSVTVTADSTAQVSVQEIPGTAAVQLLLMKKDAETDTPQGSASLEGAEYTVKYYDVSGDEDPEEEGKEAKYTWVMKTDAQGRIELKDTYRVGGDDFSSVTIDGNVVLPIGILTIRETKAPQGYVLNETVYTSNMLLQSGTSVVVENLPDTDEKAVREQVIRGDLEFKKADQSTGNPMAEIPFIITSKTTGETHKVFSNQEGVVSTGAIAHTLHTNEGNSSADGIWFGSGKPQDQLGALPYDTYILEELQCAANQGKDLLELEFAVSQESMVVQLGTLTNYTIDLHTTAVDQESGTKTVRAREQAVVVDQVAYDHLTAGREYTIKGVLMRKETGEPLESAGAPVTAEKTFTPDQPKGMVELSFTFDASALAGSTLVAGETLYWKGITEAVHADLEDEAQTVYVPKIETNAADPTTGDHMGAVTAKTKICDEVRYTGLTPGKEYTVKGVLMMQETGEALEIDGKPVTAEKTFLPEAPTGSIELVFTFDASTLQGKTVVVFEDIYDGVLHVAAHGDINDAAQTIFYPKLQTMAKDQKTGGQQVAAVEQTTLIDTVSYSNLIAGEYLVKGILMNQKTGEPIQIDGKNVTAEAAFTAEQAEGSVEVTYSFDGRKVSGETIVVFEDLLHGGSVIASHRDLKDEAQTVWIEKLKTPTTTPTTTPTEKPVKTPDQTVTAPVKTGDATQITGMLAVLICAAALGGVLLWRKKAHKGDGSC